jgi:hypothetical protein
VIQVGRGVSVPSETSGAQTSSRGQNLPLNISSSILFLCFQPKGSLMKKHVCVFFLSKNFSNQVFDENRLTRDDFLGRVDLERYVVALSLSNRKGHFVERW